MRNPVSKSLFHCSIKKILHVIPFVCVYLKSVKYSLWKELEALQHQRALGMHPCLNTPTLPTPHAHPHHKRKHQSGRTRLLAVAHLIFDETKEVYETEFSGIVLKSSGFKLSCTWLLDAVNVQKFMKGLKCLCLMLKGNVLNENHFSNEAKSFANTSTSPIFL